MEVCFVRFEITAYFAHTGSELYFDYTGKLNLLKLFYGLLAMPERHLTWVCAGRCWIVKKGSARMLLFLFPSREAGGFV